MSSGARQPALDTCSGADSCDTVFMGRGEMTLVGVGIGGQIAERRRIGVATNCLGEQ